MALATFGSGCFWKPQYYFSQLPVEKTAVGYMGGHTNNPTYQDVCTDTTGHVEVVHITFDPKKISYEELLKTFWSLHDPTQKNRQGPDVGGQYKSVIFYHDETQKKLAENSKSAQQGNHQRPIATEIVQAGVFYPAESYHQDYLKKRGKTSCGV